MCPDTPTQPGSSARTEQDEMSLTKRQSFSQAYSDKSSIEITTHISDNDGDLHETIADMVHKRNKSSVDKGIGLHQAESSFTKRPCLFQAISQECLSSHESDTRYRATSAMKHMRIAMMKMFTELLEVLVQEFLGRHHINKAVQVS